MERIWCSWCACEREAEHVYKAVYVSADGRAHVSGKAPAVPEVVQEVEVPYAEQPAEYEAPQEEIQQQ